MLNGDGIRVVLWVSGCSLHCVNCQNPQTWDFNSGVKFDEEAKKELFEALSQPYIKGITFSGGHPLEEQNISTIYDLINKIKQTLPNKDIWLYTGYTLDIYDFIKKDNLKSCILNMCDVVVDGRYIDELKNPILHWRGSTNQRVIDVKKTIKNNIITLYCN